MPKNRNIALCIIFSIITCGIYALYWIVALTDETNQIAGEPDDTSGITALILMIVTCNIYAFYWAYKRGEKIDKAHQLRGEAASNGGVLYLILYLFGAVISLALIQSEVNKFAKA